MELKGGHLAFGGIRSFGRDGTSWMLELPIASVGFCDYDANVREIENGGDTHRSAYGCIKIELPL